MKSVDPDSVGYISQTPLVDIDKCDGNGVDWLDAEKWVRTENDRRAIDAGCWFDPWRAAWAAWWMERNLVLYEGDFAGQPIRFLSTAEDPQFQAADGSYVYWDVPYYDGESGVMTPEILAFYRARMRRHNQLKAAGADMHWMAEAVFQVYGWVRNSDNERLVDPRTGLSRTTGKPVVVRRFIEAMIWIAKKNGKSPFMTANGLYLAFGDGESGASVGFGAASLQQARKIVGNHAIKMIQLSPTLSENAPGSLTRINKAECSITIGDHKMFPVSAGNVRTANTEHGGNMNGSVIDEVHVCGRQVGDRLRRAGRSRREPLMWKGSTAGDNPDSWGKEEYTRAEGIVSGEVKDIHTYAAVFTAPQEATDDEIAAHIREYILMANPASGHIVSVNDAVRDFESVRYRPAELATFKYEILNIWVQATITWLPAGLYANCGRWSLSAEDKQARAVIGFDNAQTKDLAAACLAREYWFDPEDSTSLDALRLDFPGVNTLAPEHLYEEAVTARRGCMLEYQFWTNEKRVAELRTFIPQIDDWIRRGFLKVCAGTANSMQQIARDLHAMVTSNNVVGLVHDPHYCGVIIEFLTEGVQNAAANVVIEPCLTSAQVLPMLQTTNTQAGPVAMFELDLRRQVIGHDDNPIATWQFSHANVHRDKQGNQRIEKSDRKSFKTVDGCQAAVMARWGLLECTEFGDGILNHYETNELEMF